MAGDEVGDELLAEPLLAVDAVEDALEGFKLGKRGLAHDVQHAVGGVLGGYLQPPADVAGYQFVRVLACSLVDGSIRTFVQQQVVAHAAADERTLDARQGINGMVDVEQRTVVGVQVGAYLRVDARGALALHAAVLVASLHTVHVGTGSSQVAQVAFEVGQLHHGLHFAQDALFGAADDELALVGRDGAEGTASETSTVDVDGELNHVVGRDAFALVLGVRQARVGQVVGVVQLGLAHGRIGRVDHHRRLACGLQDARGGIFVALLLDVAEVGRLLLLVGQALLVRVEADVAFELGRLAGQVGHLRQLRGYRCAHVLCGGQCAVVPPGLPLAHPLYQFGHGLFAHSIHQQVGTALRQDAGAYPLLPVVVVGEPSHAGFNASQYHRHIGEEAFQYLRIDDGGVLRPHVGAGVGRIGIVAAQPLVGRVFVHHRVHAACADPEEEAWTAQLLEVAQVVAPVGLGHNGHPQPFRFEDAAYDRRAKRGMVYVGVAAEQDDVQFVPSPQLHLLLGSGQPVGQPIRFHSCCLVNCTRISSPS